jgi:hypothetical protein
VPVDTATLHYTFGPTVAVVVVCLLGVLLRWVFGSGRNHGGTRGRGERRDVAAGANAARTEPAGRGDQAHTGEPADGSASYGLLRAAVTAEGQAEGNALRTLLSEAGIRSTLTVRPDGRVDVLVFREDLARARQLLPPVR